MDYNCGFDFNFMKNLFLFVSILNVILSVVVIFGNCMIFLVIYRMFGLWINFNYLIVLFVVVDFFVGLIMNLLYVVKVGLVI